VNFRWLSEERETYVLGLLRAAFALLMLLLTLKLARQLVLIDYFGDFFHLPMVPESLVPSRNGYVAVLAVQGICSVAALLGFFTRPALLVASSLGIFTLLWDRLDYHNNRYELLLLVFLVALTPCDRSFLPLRRARPGPGPRWAVTLVGAQVSAVYLASSLGKLFDHDWRGGVVLSHRFDKALPFFDAHQLHALGALVASPAFAHTASLAAIASELFLALGLWFRPTRALALWLGFMFHAGIEIVAHVELFSYTMIAGYLAFVTPELRERTLSFSLKTPAGQRCASLCRHLDLLARFQHASAPDQAPLLRVTDRSGATHEGLPAWRELARAFPPLFPLWLPLALITFRKPAPSTTTS
jgi:hypothetical protein